MDEFLGKFKRKLFVQIIVRVFVSTVIIFLALFLADGIFNETIANLISDLDRGFYVFIRQHKIETYLLLFSVVVVVSICLSLAKTTRYMEDVIRSIDKVFQKDSSLIVLPKDFKDVENKLNSIKYQKLRSEQLALEEEQRKNDMVMYLAHDLKTPLTSVIGYLTLLNNEKELSASVRERYLKVSLDKAVRLEDLIDDFFEITRFSMKNFTLTKSTIDLSLMLNQLVDEFYPQLKEHNLTCQVEVPPKLTFYGDGDKLARVFDNLIRNAVNYSYPGTQIQVTCALERSEEYLSGQQIHLCFASHGEVIPPRKLEKIFEKFYRLDSARSGETGGAGLGLAIAQEVVTLHQGRITAESDWDSTRFYIWLPVPLRRQEPEEKEGDGPSRTDAAGGERTAERKDDSLEREAVLPPS